MSVAPRLFLAVALLVPAPAWCEESKPDPWAPVRFYAPDRSTATRVVFESESFENFNNKWRARETYEILGSDEVIEIFELAPPEKPFQVYGTNRLKRVGG